MLQLTDEGAKITLTGQSTPTGDGLFWFGSALLIGAVAVAMAMSLLPERWAIGALALLIVGSFIFNRQRQQKKAAQSQMTQIDSGVLKIHRGGFTQEVLGKQQHIRLAEGDCIESTANQLSIMSADNQCKCRVTGFETEQEIAVMAAILQGKTMNKRHAKIKMQSN